MLVKAFDNIGLDLRGKHMRRVIVAGLAACLLAQALVLAMPIANPGADPTGSADSRRAQGVAATGAVQAVTVGDVTINEADVALRETTFRSVASLESDDAWAGWLASQNMTPQEYRSQVMDQLVHEELVRQAAADQGVYVSDEDVDKQIDLTRDQYLQDFSQYPEDEQQEFWRNALALNGYDEGLYHESVRAQLLEAALAKHVTAQGEDYPTWLESHTPSAAPSAPPILSS